MLFVRKLYVDKLWNMWSHTSSPASVIIWEQIYSNVHRPPAKLAVAVGFRQIIIWSIHLITWSSEGDGAKFAFIFLLISLKVYES